MPCPLAVGSLDRDDLNVAALQFINKAIDPLVMGEVAHSTADNNYIATLRQLLLEILSSHLVSFVVTSTDEGFLLLPVNVSVDEENRDACAVGLFKLGSGEPSGGEELLPEHRCPE